MYSKSVTKVVGIPNISVGTWSLLEVIGVGSAILDAMLISSNAMLKWTYPGVFKLSNRK